MRVVISSILKIALGITGLITAAVFLAPNLVSIGMVFLIVPGLILAVTPTIFLYLTIFSAAWFPLSRRSLPLGIGAGLAFVYLFAFTLPALWNRLTGTRLREAQSKEVTLQAQVNLAGVVGLRTPESQGSAASCGDLCQTLLYDADVERVVLLPARTGTPVSFRVERHTNCPEMDPNDVRQNGVTRWMKETDSSRVAAATRLRIAGGECLAKEPWTGSPNWTIARVREDFGSRPGDLSLLPGEVHAEGLQLSDQKKVLARQSRLHARILITPLHLTPRGGSELRMLGWEWARARDYQAPIDTREFLAGFAAPSQLPDVSASDPDAIRRALDTALDDPAAGTAAFSVVDDYYRSFGSREKPKIYSDDVRRLARLIADPRVTTFWHMPLTAAHSTSDLLLLRDPILDRMTQLARQEKWDSYRALDALTRHMPEAAFQKPDPRVDAMLADPDLRRAAPNLVLRLSDRGAVAATELARIATQGWGPRTSTRRVPPGNPSDDSRSAIEGLCRLGSQARAVLPQLRQAAASGSVPAGIQEGDRWRAMLISLGASSSEFELPKNRKWLLDQYQQDLERAARACKENRR